MDSKNCSACGGIGTVPIPCPDKAPGCCVAHSATCKSCGGTGKVMDAPIKIRAKAWQGMSTPGGTWSSDSYKDDEITEYIRSDLVDKLIGYAVHDDDCRWCFPGDHDGHGPCTCGLSDLIREVRSN